MARFALMFTSGALFALSAAVLSQGPLVRLPAPTGPYRVGTTGWQVHDRARRETLDGASAMRQIQVLAWYPADSPSRRRAPYLRNGLVEIQDLGRRLGGRPGAFDALARVATHATIDAPVLKTTKFPVLVFSHGYGGVASAHTALLEDLASHGYIALHVVHPYEATAARLDDGRIVSFLGENGQPRQAFLGVVGEWAREDQAMADVTSAAGEDEQRRLLRQYLSGLSNTTIALQRWVDDTRAVLDDLPRRAATTPAGALIPRMDMTRIGVAGHSMGGVTAADFCAVDRRCRGALNLDGIPQYGAMIDGSFNRPFLMVYSARAGRTGASDAIYRRASARYYRVDVADTLHLDFSDMILWSPLFSTKGALGSIDPQRAVAITRAIVREYFDFVLDGTPSRLLAGRSGFPEVTVR